MPAVWEAEIVGAGPLGAGSDFIGATNALLEAEESVIGGADVVAGVGALAPLPDAAGVGDGVLVGGNAPAGSGGTTKSSATTAWNV